MNLEYTRHALHVMAERMIPAEWVELTVADPAFRTPDPNDADGERFFRSIPEHCDRALRVAVTTRVGLPGRAYARDRPPGRPPPYSIPKKIPPGEIPEVPPPRRMHMAIR